jgi:hypothetical protein
MNTAEKLHHEFLREIERLLCHSQRAGDLAPAGSMEEWERTVELAPESSRELLRELARFADLWRFLREREQELGDRRGRRNSRRAHAPPAERVARLKQSNRKLMGRVEGASRGFQLRH